MNRLSKARLMCQSEHIYMWNPALLIISTFARYDQLFVAGYSKNNVFTETQYSSWPAISSSYLFSSCMSPSLFLSFSGSSKTQTLF